MSSADQSGIRVIDSHTGGEPTRVVSTAGRIWAVAASRSASKFSRRVRPLSPAVVNEPRGSDVLVGALLSEPHDGLRVGVIFFNNVGYLGMCGHGTIGLVARSRTRAARARRAPHRNAGRLVDARRCTRTAR